MLFLGTKKRFAENKRNIDVLNWYEREGRKLVLKIVCLVSVNVSIIVAELVVSFDFILFFLALKDLQRVESTQLNRLLTVRKVKSKRDLYHASPSSRQFFLLYPICSDLRQFLKCWLQYVILSATSYRTLWMSGLKSSRRIISECALGKWKHLMESMRI